MDCVIMNYTVDKVSKVRCTGCGSCISVCHKNAITLKENDDGFLYPNIAYDNCVECGNCYKKCPIGKKFNYEDLKAYFFFLNDVMELRHSSSGGAATAMANYVVEEKGGIVYGVVYSEDYKHAKFFRAENKDEIKKLKGSKYSESFPPDYKDIKNDLDEGREVLFIGLPCQAAGLKTYLGASQYNNLTIVSLICLGKSSMKLFRNFINELEINYGSRIMSLNMRYKRKNWNISWIKATFANEKRYEKILTTESYGLLRHLVFRPSCYQCEFKIDNPAENILIGDFWGGEFLPYKKQNPMGMSAIITLDSKGDELISKLGGYLEAVDLSKVMRTNGAISKSYIKPSAYTKLIQNINDNVSLDKICNDYFGAKEIIMMKLKCYLKSKLPNRLIIFAKRVKHR